MTYEEQTAYIEEIPRFSSKNPPAHTRLCLERLETLTVIILLYTSREQTEREVSVPTYLASVFWIGALRPLFLPRLIL